MVTVSSDAANERKDQEGQSAVTDTEYRDFAHDTDAGDRGDTGRDLDAELEEAFPPARWQQVKAPVRDAEGRFPESVRRGRCPDCRYSKRRGDLISLLFFVPGSGYLAVWACEHSIAGEGGDGAANGAENGGDAGQETDCRYRRVL